MKPFPTRKIWNVANDMRELEDSPLRMTKSERLEEYQSIREDIESLLADYEGIEQ